MVSFFNFIKKTYVHCFLANPHDPIPLKTNGKINGAKSNYSTADSRFDAGLQDMKIAHAMKVRSKE
jgi:hypothetical protein